MSARGLSSRTWVLGGVGVALLLAAVAWLVVIAPLRGDTQTLRGDAESAESQNLSIVAKTNVLRRQAEQRAALVAQVEAAQAGLPSGPGLPVFSRQIARQAAARGVTLTSVSIGTPLTADGSTIVTNASTSDVPLAIPLTVQASGPALNQLLFIRDVERAGPRLALVTSTSLAPSDTATDDTASAAGTSVAAPASIDDGALLTLQVTVFTNPLDKATRQALADATAVGADSADS